MVGGQRRGHQGACDLAHGPARGTWASAVQAGSNLKGMKGQEKPPEARMLGWRAGKLRPPQGLVGGGYQVRGAHPDPRGHRKQDREGRSQARLSTGVGWQAWVERQTGKYQLQPSSGPIETHLVCGVSRGSNTSEKPAQALRRLEVPRGYCCVPAPRPHLLLSWSRRGSRGCSRSLISSVILTSRASYVCHLPAHPQRRVRAAQPPPLCPLQDDMHRVIDRQLMDTHLKEQSRPAAALSRAHGSRRGDEPSTAEGKRLFSFFRKI